MHHETAIFGPQEPNPEIPEIIFCPCLLFQQQKHKNALKPIFYSVLAKSKMRLFKNSTQNTES